MDKQTAQVEGQGKSLPLLDGLLGAPRPIAPDPVGQGAGIGALECRLCPTLWNPLV